MARSAPVNQKTAPSVERIEFDSEAFGLPFYRVRTLDGDRLENEVAKLKRMPGGLVIDAKVAAEDTRSGRLLMQLGFRKICTQVTMKHTLGDTTLSPGIEVGSTLPLAERTVWEHAQNFRYDRFTVDPLLPEEGRHRLYFQWITNSLMLGKKRIAYLGDDFCSFSEDGEGVVIDLLSVLQPGQGIATMLVDRVIRHAKDHGAPGARVTTECENRTAWRLYLRRGFQVSEFVSVYHFVRLAPSE